MSEGGAPDPLMLRVYKGDKKGATAFFRNRPFLNVLASRLLAIGGVPRVLFQACSIGAEPYSLSIDTLNRGIDVHIDATDIEPDFIASAKNAIYPATIAKGMTQDEEKWFHSSDAGAFSLDEAVRTRVNFLPAQSLTDPMPGTYDVTLAMNVLTYLSVDAQTVAIRKMAANTRHYLCLTAFHPDTIRHDLESVGFEPDMEMQDMVHNAWGDRLRPQGAEPGTPEYSWVVPPYNRDRDDYAWRYGAIFKKKP